MSNPKGNDVIVTIIIRFPVCDYIYDGSQQASLVNFRLLAWWFCGTQFFY